MAASPSRYNSDWELIQACRAGDESAWQQIIDQYKRLVFSIPLTHGLTESDAADIFQLTFMMLMQSLGNMHKDSHLGGWLATVARRNTWHLLNRHRRENVGSDDLDENYSLLDEADEREKERRELLHWLYDGLVHLDETCRTLLVNLYFDPGQPSYQQVASRMGLAVGSIGPMRATCLRRLRDALLERQ
jgi:RNA polymerase sigma factor (sigma-70 family)